MIDDLGNNRMQITIIVVKYQSSSRLENPRLRSNSTVIPPLNMKNVWIPKNVRFLVIVWLQSDVELIAPIAPDSNPKCLIPIDHQRDLYSSNWIECQKTGR